MKIEVSNGEIIDKYTILEIKLSEIKDEKKLVNIQHEYDTLTPDVQSIYTNCNDEDQLKKLHNDLLEVNKKLWKIEDDIRECERANDFGQTFIDLARAVYYTNDDRSDVKKEINVLTGSDLVEEKSYEDYKSE
jgi:peptidoglycan hydrolase CwlO-like protein